MLSSADSNHGYCLVCGTPLEARHQEDRERPTCPSCGFIHYLDPKVAVAVILGNEHGVLLGRRRIDPGSGLWSFPAGYVNRGEVLEEAARPAIGVLAILRAAVVLAERDQDAAALPLALAAVALEPLDLGEVAVEIRAHLLDLVVERDALRRLSAEQGEEATALATQPLRLLAEPIELGLLFGCGVLVPLDLVGLAGVVGWAAVDDGELAFEP